MTEKKTKLTDEELELLDVILLTLSRSFARAVLYKKGSGWAWHEPSLVTLAISDTIYTLKKLIVGFDDRIDEMERFLKTDTAYKAPEQGAELAERFVWLRNELVKANVRVTPPIVAKKGRK